MDKILCETSLTNLSSNALKRIDESKLVLCDLDGCLAINNVPLPGAMELLNRVQEKLVIVSNNSTHSRDQMSEELTRNGFRINAQRIYLAGEIAIERVARCFPNSRVCLIGSDELQRIASVSKLHMDDVRPDVVVLARDLDVSVRRLQVVIGHLKRGIKLYVANPDSTHPGSDGVPQIETGAVLALLKAVLPDLSDTIVGKPERGIFDTVLQERGIAPGEAVMLGDNVDTDIAGARRVGISGIWIPRCARGDVAR